MLHSKKLAKIMRIVLYNYCIIHIFMTTLLVQSATSTEKNYTHIVWDLGNVLLKADTAALSFEIGLADLARYTLQGNNPLKLFNKLNDILGTLGQQEIPRGNLPVVSNGFTLPKITCDFFRGVINSENLIHITRKKIDALYSERTAHAPTSSIEKQLIERLLNLLYNPACHQSYKKIVPAGLELVAQCAQQKKADGSKAYTQILFANYEREGFEFLKKNQSTSAIFNYFDTHHCMISSMVQSVKPHKDIFEKLIKYYQLNPQYTIIIDDDTHTLQTAELFGFTTIYVPNLQLNLVEKQLKELGVLP